MGYNDETTRDALYDVPSDVEALRSEAEALKKQQEASTSAEAAALAENYRVNNLIKKGYMSIKEAIDNKIKPGERVIIKKKFNIFSKGVEGSLTNISLKSGSDPPKATMTISCLNDICKNSQDSFDSSERNIKSFDDNYEVKVISGPPPRHNGGKSNRKSKKFNRKSKKSNRKSNRKSNKRYNKKSKKINF